MGTIPNSEKEIKRKKEKYIEIKNIIEEKGFTLISDKYEGQVVKLNLICPHGHEFLKEWKVLNKEGIKCSICSKLNKKGKQPIVTPIDEVIKIFTSEKYKIISGIETYKDTKSIFILECPYGHCFSIDKHHFYIRNQRCPHCSSSKKLTIEFCKNEFLNKGYQLIQNEYINSSTKMAYICPNHPNTTQYICWDNFKQGEGCSLCRNEYLSSLQRLDFDFVKSQFLKRDYILLTDFYINNNQILEYICSKHSDKGIQKIQYADLAVGTGCKHCFLENKSGENACNWQGGITKIRNYLRESIVEWQKLSMKNCNYRCIITGSYFDNIHHLYGFNLIMDEIFQYSNIKIKKSISEYSNEELELLKTLCKNYHNKYPLGVCLNKIIHNLFHKLYKNKNNTPEQFEEFKTRLKSGEFNLFLEENKLKLII